MNKQILASLLVIGAVGALATGSTFALFNDTEMSDGNVFQAGEVNLMMDYTEYYNGQLQEEQNISDGGPMFEFDDVKPGDQGEAETEFQVISNPSYIWMRTQEMEDADNSCMEPEAEAENNGSCDQDGELDEAMDLTIWRDSDGDREVDDNEEIIHTGEADLSSGIRLDANPSTEEVEAFQPNNTKQISIKWSVPRDTGNIIQTDSYAFDMEFYAEQARHNDNPVNPWTGTTDGDSTDNQTDDDQTGNQTDGDQTDGNTTDGNQTDGNVSDGNQTNGDGDVSDGSIVDSVVLCTDNGDPANQCPSDESELVQFDWNGTAYVSSDDSVDASVDVVDSNEVGPTEVEVNSEQELSSIVVISGENDCTLPPTDTSIGVCQPTS